MRRASATSTAICSPIWCSDLATARSDVYTVRGATGPSPDRILSGDGSAAIDLDNARGRTSGIAIVDLDNDGDLDVVLARNVNGREPEAKTALYRNDGGSMIEVDAGFDPSLGGRSIGVLDVDGDGLLDLMILEDRYRGGSSQLYRNDGNLQFSDSGAQWGFPSDVDGLGVATGDLNGDGWTDVFVAGANRTFLGTGSGLDEADIGVPVWETFGPEDDVSGAAIADINRDGKPDLLIGHHFNSTLSQDRSEPVRLYLNVTDPGGPVMMEDATEAAGLVGIPTKAPHVEIADLNNDGWPDIVTTASAESGTAPAIFVANGADPGGVPTFTPPTGMGAGQYWVSSPTVDIDRDGRLDLFSVEWDPSLPSIMFRNTTASGHWLEVSIGDDQQAVGATVSIYPTGAAGDASQLLGAREIVGTLGYTAAVELHAHFGLGDHTVVDVVVTLPRSESIVFTNVEANQHVAVGGCS